MGEGYFAVSTGNGTDNVIEDYIKRQDEEPQYEDFKVQWRITL